MVRVPNISLGLQNTFPVIVWLLLLLPFAACTISHASRHRGSPRAFQCRASPEQSRDEPWNGTAPLSAPCNNPNFHGHNYEVELCVDGEIEPDTGYVIDVGVVKPLFDQHVHAQLDHRNLNLDVPWFASATRVDGEHCGLHLGAAGRAHSLRSPRVRQVVGDSAQLRRVSRWLTAPGHWRDAPSSSPAPPAGSVPRSPGAWPDRGPADPGVAIGDAAAA